MLDINQCPCPIFKANFNYCKSDNTYLTVVVYYKVVNVSYFRNDILTRILPYTR